MSYHSWPSDGGGGGSGGSPFWGDAVSNLAALPASGSVIGEFRQTLDTKSIWRWTGTVWEIYLDIPGEIAQLDGLTGKIQDQLDAITSDITAIDSDLGAAESDIDDLQAADVALDGRLDIVEGRLDTYDGLNLNTRLSGAESEIDTLQSNETALTSRVGDLESNRVLKAGDTMTGPLVLSGDPTLPLGAATKAYVDSISQNMRWKSPVRAATTANITLSGPQTIDGVSVIAGDRVLVKNQTTASDNGIYQVGAGAWARTLDGDTFLELNGAICLVQEGTANGDKGFQQTAELTSLASNQTWIQNFGVSLYQADGFTIEQTGNTFRVKDGGIDLSGLKVTGVAPISRGGTNANTQAGAFKNLSPQTTKGDLIGFNATDPIRIPVGPDGYAVKADSSLASGFGWKPDVQPIIPVSTVGTSKINTVELIDASGGFINRTLPVIPAEGGRLEYVDILEVFSETKFLRLIPGAGNGIYGYGSDNLVLRKARDRIVLFAPPSSSVWYIEYSANTIPQEATAGAPGTIPYSIRFQTKFLPSTSSMPSTETAAAAMTFNGLTVGRSYEVSGQLVLTVNTANQPCIIRLRQGSGISGTLIARIPFNLPSTSGNAGLSVSVKFVATATVMQVTYDGAGSISGQIQGDGTAAQSFLQLTEIPATVVTTWT